MTLTTTHWASKVRTSPLRVRVRMRFVIHSSMSWALYHILYYKCTRERNNVCVHPITECEHTCGLECVAQPTRNNCIATPVPHHPRGRMCVMSERAFGKRSWIINNKSLSCSTPAPVPLCRMIRNLHRWISMGLTRCKPNGPRIRVVTISNRDHPCVKPCCDKQTGLCVRVFFFRPLYPVMCTSINMYDARIMMR